MIRLNLPSYDIKLRGTEGHYQVLDPLRRRWVALTPEEWVRQHFIHWLTSSLGYPTALLANEVPLRIGSKDLRADSVLYDSAQYLVVSNGLCHYCCKLDFVGKKYLFLDHIPNYEEL